MKKLRKTFLLLVPLAAIRHAGGTLIDVTCFCSGISLVNPTTIFQEQATRQVTYHHLELESHDILLAEGCPCEPYLDTGTRLQAA